MLAGPLLSSLSVYLILSQLLFPSDIAVTLSIILFSLLLGLSIYFQVDSYERTKKRNDVVQKRINVDTNSSRQSISLSNLIFIVVYVVSIVIVGTSKPFDITGEIFTAWNDLFASPIQIIQLGSAALLSFFFPGYAFVYLLVKVYPLELLPKLLLSFLFSMLLTGFTVYVAAIMIGVPALYLNQIIIGVDVIVLILFIIYLKNKNTLLFDFDTIASFFYQSASKIRMIVNSKKNISLFMIFTSLFALVVFYTYYLDKGVIVGDQWFHHGRALLINSGNFKDIASSGADWFYPPFFSALLAGFFSLSGVSSVNAYVSIHFLNIMPVFAFYYFFTCWIPSNRRKAVVLASTLFVLSSGFGWTQVLYTSLTNNDPNSEESSLENLYQTTIRSSDIRTPNTFINVGHPTFTTPLIIIGLPAGFVILGLLKEEKGKKIRLGFVGIITAITVLGILSHDEFYLFILVGTILTLLFRLSYGNLIYASIILAIFICFIIDFLSPDHYYAQRTILKIPLLILSLIFVSVLWGLHLTRILCKLHGLKSGRYNFLKTRFLNSSSKKAVAIVIVSILAYLYLFTFMVWETLSTNDIRLHLGTLKNYIPWYLYPMKFGLTGLLGLAFIISYLFRRFEKVIFVFGIIAIIALLAGPYYNEHRFSKYIMVGTTGFASILVYKIILFLQRPHNDLRHHYSHTISRLEPLASSILLGVVVTAAALSVLMLAGYKELAYDHTWHREIFYRIDFPTSSEMNLLNFFRSELSYFKTHFVAIMGNDWQTGKLSSKLEGFSAIPKARILKNPQSLNAPTLERLNTSLADENIKYIILLKKDISAEKQSLKPTHFTSRYFQQVYQDDSYIVLKVPDLASPSKSLDVPGNTMREDRKQAIFRLPALRLPADISESAKEKGIWVPWQRTLMSFESIVTMMTITVSVVVYYMWPKMKKYNRL